ncbi:hypothetical protein LCGC14_0902170 [marine sediment metagenome]|uniref:Uncharacterized protein n=1 Tax=marine sediment metagenome TaxID=412755 RepID=A0A0F9RF63_9ZZZZ
MADTYSTLRTAILQKLQDTGSADFQTGEIDDRMKDGLRHFARYVPHIVRVPYTIESRTGAATATTAGSLVDTGESQFLAGDVGKIIHNLNDNTWAVVKTFTSTSVLVLSRDIMVSGEEYEMYNKECVSNKQINLEDVEDPLWVERVEFPIGAERSFSLRGTILTIGIDFTPDDTKAADANKIVHVFFAKRHKVSQLTDLLGAVDLGAGYSEGDTTMTIDEITNDEIVEEDQEFTVAGLQEIYTVKAAVTIAGSQADVTFFPGLEADVAEDIVVTFILSTFEGKYGRQLEALFVDYVAAIAASSKATKYINAIPKGGPGVSGRFQSWAQLTLQRVQRDLMAMADPPPNKILTRAR